MQIRFPHSPGTGGPGSFQCRFERVLKAQGWVIKHGAKTTSGRLPDVVMVVGGTRQLPWLRRMRLKGVPIVYRLDGLLWLHRVAGFRVAPSRWLGSEVRNAMAQWIHGQAARCVVYQSDFVRNWWQRKGWWQAKESVVIPNGLDLNEFHPGKADAEGLRTFPDVVCVEGHVDYSPYAIELLNIMAAELDSLGARLIVFGGFAKDAPRECLDPRIDYRGLVARESVPEVYRGRVFLSLDVNPACPNAVAEALASGAPVIGFDTGSVKELVGGQAGCIAPFGADPWSGEPPEMQGLIEAYQKVAENFDTYSLAARARAETYFGLDKMVESYVEVIERTIDQCPG